MDISKVAQEMTTSQSQFKKYTEEQDPFKSYLFKYIYNLYLTKVIIFLRAINLSFIFKREYILMYKYLIYITFYFICILFLSQPISASNSLITSKQYLDTTMYQRILINKDIIEAFKKIWNEENAPLTYDEYIKKDTIIGEFEYQIMKNTIFDYLQNVDTIGDTLGLFDVIRKELDLYVEEKPVVEEVPEKKLVVVVETDTISPETIKMKEEKDLAVKEKVISKKDIKPKEKKIQNIEYPYKISNNIIFKVQVAANGEHLSIPALKERYKGNMPVFIKNEEGWYKYQIGGFNSYYDAAVLKNNSNVSDAFIVGYRNNQKINFPEFREFAQKYNQPSNNHNIFYKVQVAASRIILPNYKINNIYSGDSVIDMVIENGWYKYQIGTFNKYQCAINIKENINVPDAFIVAYSDGEKINIKDAIASTDKDIRTNKKVKDVAFAQESKKKIDDDIIFYIQIAADKKPLSNYKLLNLYKGTMQIKISYEDGWYKYMVGDFSTYYEAAEFKRSLNIFGSFIVPYQSGERISLSDAFKYTKK